MKTLKRIGIFIAAFLLLLLVISFFLPAKVHVERVAVINAQPAIVFNQVNNLHNWNNWMPWNKLDPNMKITYFGPEEGTGAGYSWMSDNEQVGKGKLSITESKTNQSIITSLDFMEHGIATGSFGFEEADGGTKVTWGMDMDMGMNPMARYLGLFMDQMLGGDFDKGLSDLKRTSESYTPPVQPEINPMPADSTEPAVKPS
ncbi:MAG: SRPBCC family protein [Chitinophagaceae bacterium]|nr:SRPBCC family protein [Chitinophagaceae bacterium]